MTKVRIRHKIKGREVVINRSDWDELSVAVKQLYDVMEEIGGEEDDQKNRQQKTEVELSASKQEQEKTYSKKKIRRRYRRTD